MHGDALCDSWLGGKRAGWGITHIDGSASFTIPDYNTFMVLCDHHYEKWSEIRYEKGDKGFLHEKPNFGQVRAVPKPRYGAAIPSWARRVNREKYRKVRRAKIK